MIVLDMMMMMMMMMIMMMMMSCSCGMVDRRKAFPAGIIFRDLHHDESAISPEWDLNLRRT